MYKNLLCKERSVLLVFINQPCVSKKSNYILYILYIHVKYYSYIPHGIRGGWGCYNYPSNIAHRLSLHSLLNHYYTCINKVSFLIGHIQLIVNSYQRNIFWGQGRTFIERKHQVDLMENLTSVLFNKLTNGYFLKSIFPF